MYVGTGKITRGHDSSHSTSGVGSQGVAMIGS